MGNSPMSSCAYDPNTEDEPAGSVLKSDSKKSKGARSALEEMSKGGKFIRKASTFRHWIKEGGEFPPEANRYRLVVSYACPWANRTLAVRALKGLEDIIAITVVHPTWGYTKEGVDEHAGWMLAKPDDPPRSNLLGFGEFPCAGCEGAEVFPDFKSVRDLYESVGYEGKYTVPVLYDSKTKKIVNNESSEIILMLNDQFNEWAKNPDLDLNPEELRDAQKEADEWIYPGINNGVYKCGFAKKQGAYETAHAELYAALDKLEDLLSRSRYVCGDALTLSDVRLFMTLIRFDEVYTIYFKCSGKRIRDYPNIRNYTRELYQMNEIASTINMSHIKVHYYTSHPSLNKYAIVPVGNNVLEDMWEPHNREEIPKQAPVKVAEKQEEEDVQDGETSANAEVKEEETPQKEVKESDAGEEVKAVDDQDDAPVVNSQEEEVKAVDDQDDAPVVNSQEEEVKSADIQQEKAPAADAQAEEVQADDAGEKVKAGDEPTPADVQADDAEEETKAGDEPTTVEDGDDSAKKPAQSAGEDEFSEPSKRIPNDPSSTEKRDPMNSESHEKIDPEIAAPKVQHFGSADMEPVTSHSIDPNNSASVPTPLQ